ncbi:MAG: hypothetical protein AAGM16_09195 [Pseudomonadota bacterium]
MPTEHTQRELQIKHLSEGARLLTLGMREWTRALHDAECGGCAVRELYLTHGFEAAAPVANEIMCYTASVATKALQIWPDPFCDVGGDELRIVNIARAVEYDDPESAYELCGDLFPGSLATTFLRIMRAFTYVAGQHGLSMNGKHGLSLVADNTPKRSQSARA